MIEGSVPVSFVNVGDRDRATAFYRDVLGLALKSSDDFGSFFDMGGALLRMTPFPHYQAGPHPVLGWNVADISAAVADLRGKGVAFTIYEGMGQDADGVWTSPDGAAKVAWFADSEGNVLSLSEA
ncbi:VOC family protein [Sphingomonas crocodyli]|uniref:VOC family protein n=1 Tax=Sphingomonas crocodyli TaxID=1979270 RepID=A0A437M6V6_9SPHN|nr:VOC family protein [Sphingomonas crocodyli]RVT93402.1 VOC family protein [Sphingomonas crocodyli]